MVTQVSAIQSVMETYRPPCGIESLPMHLRDLLDQTSRDLDDVQQRQLAGVLLRYTYLFPIPGSTLTGHTDAMCTPPDVPSEDEDGGTRFCIDYRRSMMRLTRTPILCPELTILWICWPVSGGSLLWTWRVVTGRFHCHGKLVSRQRSRRILGCFSSRLCRSDCATRRPHSRD